MRRQSSQYSAGDDNSCHRLGAGLRGERSDRTSAARGACTTLDSNGQQLTGVKKYTITFRETPPFIEPGFWSLTMYDASNYYTVSNSINRYFLGSDTPMKKNTDGSITIYIQKDSPGADKESNWLPAPAGPFYLIPRAYAPGSAMVESLSDARAYTPPPVVEVT